MRLISIVRAWRERIHSTLRTKLSGESVSFLSAAFSMNDPLLRTLDRHRKKQHQCVLLLLNIENYSQMLYPGNYEQIAAAERLISKHIAQLLPDYFKSENVLGLRHFHGEEFCLFLQVPCTDTFVELQARSMRFRDHLENRLKVEQELQIGGALTFGMGFYVFEKEPASTKLAVSIAYHYAQAIATKKVPETFCQSRKELMEIVDKEAVLVLAQPIMDLHSGDIFGWEMLTRGPENTPYHSPTELFEFAYQTDMLAKLELVVIKKAFREIAERSIREQVFINVTSLTLANTQVYDELVDYLSLFPSVRPHQIVLEITERHSIRDYRQMSETMSRYRKLGFRFALDDAGAGYASLQSISELIPDIIKIDRSLIQNIDQGKIKQSLLKALMQFAQDIQCEVIAEGIEREEEADVLYQHDVTKAQGYLYAKPAPLHLRNNNLIHFNEIKEKIRLRAQTNNKLA